MPIQVEVVLTTPHKTKLWCFNFHQLRTCKLLSTSNTTCTTFNPPPSPTLPSHTQYIIPCTTNWMQSRKYSFSHQILRQIKECFPLLRSVSEKQLQRSVPSYCGKWVRIELTHLNSISLFLQLLIKNGVVFTSHFDYPEQM